MWAGYKECVQGTRNVRVQEMKKISRTILTFFLPTLIFEYFNILIFFRTLFTSISRLFNLFTQYYCLVEWKKYLKKFRILKKLGVQEMWGWYKEFEEGTRNVRRVQDMRKKLQETKKIKIKILVPLSNFSYPPLLTFFYLHQFLNFYFIF